MGLRNQCIKLRVSMAVGGLGSVSAWVYLELRPFDLSGFTASRLNVVYRIFKGSKTSPTLCPFGVFARVGGVASAFELAKRSVENAPMLASQENPKHR